MRIIVIGAGEVGYHIAARLSHEAHEIVVIERHPEVVRRVEETLRVRVIEADGSSPRALEEAGVRDAAMVIAVADVDEVNIVACAIAHQYGVATKIARVRDIELGEHPILAGGKVLGIDLLINPTQVVAGEILRVIKTTGAAEVADFADGRVQLLGVKVDAQAPVVNRRLRDLRSVQASAPFRVVGIARGESLIVPTEDTALAAEDHVYVVSRRDVIPDILVLMGRTAAATRQVFIIGGGRIGLEVARALEADEIAVTVLERNRSRYDELTRELARSPGGSRRRHGRQAAGQRGYRLGRRRRRAHRRRPHESPGRASRQAPRCQEGGRPVQAPGSDPAGRLARDRRRDQPAPAHGQRDSEVRARRAGRFGVRVAGERSGDARGGRAAGDACRGAVHRGDSAFRPTPWSGQWSAAIRCSRRIPTSSSRWAIT